MLLLRGENRKGEREEIESDSIPGGPPPPPPQGRKKGRKKGGVKDKKKRTWDERAIILSLYLD